MKIEFQRNAIPKAYAKFDAESSPMLCRKTNPKAPTINMINGNTYLKIKVCGELVYIIRLLGDRISFCVGNPKPNPEFRADLSIHTPPYVGYPKVQEIFLTPTSTYFTVY
jgi:hypothetical protein